ncbi:MAG: MBL fold metallo-hydrolase [Clostridium sp.]|nr:MBL fold metallo-hydrolase [Clostridium sp.]
MKIKYLGTGAYEGIPALFCNCQVCREAKELRGRNIRSRLQAIINDELLLDFPADTVWHSIQYNLDWTKIGDCLITHSHSDHLYPSDVEMAGEGFTGKHRPLHFYAAQDGYEKLREAMERMNVGAGASAALVEPGKGFLAGEDGQYQVTPLWANHNEETTPVIYSIFCGGKRILYAHDTGYFPENTWEALAGQGRYDLISLDCTGGLCGLHDLKCLGNTMKWRDNHMNIQTNLEVMERMRREKMIDENTVIIANHLSHNAGLGHEKMRLGAEKYGILTAYDGMEIEI